MSNSLNLALPYLQAAQAQKHVTVNEAMRRLDAAVQLVVESRSMTAPPPNPSEGVRYIVAAGSGGAWAGHDLEVAAYLDGAWVFFVPQEGWLAHVRAEASYVFFTGSGWDVLVASGDFETATRFGVNALADDVNRLHVQADAALFAPDPSSATPSGDTRVKVTKTSAGDVASHLFQSGYSGRAEFGLIGSDDFSLKVSPDGSAFAEALRVDRTSAQVDFSAVPSVAGAGGLGFSVPSRAALAATAVPTAVSRVETRGFATENDGGAGVYERVGSLGAADLGVVDAAGGVWSLVGDWISVRQAGARGDGTSDDTAAINAALATGRNVVFGPGRFRVTGAITTGGTYQRIVGAGRRVTVIDVEGGFDLSASGVIAIAHPGCEVSDLSIEFDQSAATGRASLVAYPWAVHVGDQKTRVRLAHLRLERAYNGVFLDGNAGGAILEDIECGALNVGFKADGCKDTVEFRNCRVWPYGFATDLTLMGPDKSTTGIYQDGNTIGFHLGKVDDLMMVGCTVLKVPVVTFAGVGGDGSYGKIVGLGLDNYGAHFLHQEGRLNLSAFYSGGDADTVPDDFHIRVRAGAELYASVFRFGMNGTSSAPLVSVEGAGSALKLSSGVLGGGNGDHTFAEVSDGMLELADVRFKAANNVNRTQPMIVVNSGLLTAVGNRVDARATGSGDALTVANDAEHVIIANHFGGYTLDLPTNVTDALVGPNGGVG